MRFQTCLFLKGGRILTEVVRAKNTAEAIKKMAAAKDVAYAPCGYAYPLRKAEPQEQDWRWNICCSVSGESSLTDQKPPAFRLVTHTPQ